MREEVLESGTVHFTLHGDALTRLARSWWADELEIERALRLLVTGLHGMTEHVAIQVLTGYAKLEGVNHFTLESDNTKTSEHGNQLSMAAVMRRILDQKTKTEFRALHLQQQMIGQQRLMASPWGAVLITECAYQRYIIDREHDPDPADLQAWWREIEPYCEYLTAHHERRQFKEEMWGEELDDDVSKYERRKLRRSQADTLEKLAEENEEDGKQTQSIVGSGLIGLADHLRAQEELLKTPPEREKDFCADNGWIAPDGSFYACGDCQHEFLAERMDTTSKKLEKTHVRISTNLLSGYRSSVMFVGKKLTKRQQTAIWDWCQHHNQECPDWVFEDEGDLL